MSGLPEVQPFETIQLELRTDDIAILTLNRPEALSTVNRTLIAELHQALDRLDYADSRRAVC